MTSDTRRRVPAGGLGFARMLREFTDKAGVAWRVWDVYPTALNRRSSGSMPAVGAARVSSAIPEFAEGWLCFESETDKRRLVPIPDGWEFRDTAGLEELCERASFKPRDGSR